MRTRSGDESMNPKMRALLTMQSLISSSSSDDDDDEVILITGLVC